MGQFEVRYVDDVVLVTLINVPNTTQAKADIFVKIGDAGINLDMISQTAPYKDKISFFFTIDNSDLPKMLKVVSDLKQLFPGIMAEVSSGNCKFAICSELLKTTPAVAAKLFKLLHENSLTAKLITTSDVEIEVLFDNSELMNINKLLTSEFV